GGARRRAGALWLRRRRDRHVSCLRRRTAARALAGDRAAERLPRAEPGGASDLPARPPVRSPAGALSTARRSDALLTVADHAVQSLQGRGHLARRLPGVRGPAAVERR